MKFKDPEIEKLYNHLCRISRQAYKDPYLISNIDFSQQECRGFVLEPYLAKEVPPKIILLFSIKNLISYAVKKFLSFALLASTALLHRISGQRVKLKEDDLKWIF
jgi:hypothetical protein